MRALMLALLLLLALPMAALAQEGTEGAAAPAEEKPAETVDTSKYSRFSSTDFNFSVLLPNSGSISKPGDEGWNEDKEIAFSWYGADNDPVALIQGRVDEFELPIDKETFDTFTSELLGHWDKDAEKFTVVGKPTNVKLGNQEWHLLQIEDNSNPEGKVFYSVFSSYSGSNIYTISLYYLQPVNSEIQNFGKPVLMGFSIP